MCNVSRQQRVHLTIINILYIPDTYIGFIGFIGLIRFIRFICFISSISTALIQLVEKAVYWDGSLTIVSSTKVLLSVQASEVHYTATHFHLVSFV